MLSHSRSAAYEPDTSPTKFQTVKMLGPCVCLMLLVFLLPACSGEPSVLTAGYERVGGKSPSPNAEKAKAQAAFAERSWEHEIESRARRYPEKRFANPSKDELIADLRGLARKNDFELVSLRFLKPRQLAPKVVIRTTHYLDLAHATLAILRRIDPRTPALKDSQGWKYEGFYFEAQDERGIPFLIAFNFERGPFSRRGPVGPQRAALSVRSWLNQDGAESRVGSKPPIASRRRAMGLRVDRVAGARRAFPNIGAGDGSADWLVGQPRIAALMVGSKGETVRFEPGSPFPQ